MLSFLKLVFGPDITVKGFDYTDDTPYYIKDGYTPQLLSWGDHACVLLKPNGSSWRLHTLKKQLKKFQELCTLPCALCLDNLSALGVRFSCFIHGVLCHYGKNGTRYTACISIFILCREYWVRKSDTDCKGTFALKGDLYKGNQ